MIFRLCLRAFDSLTYGGLCGELYERLGCFPRPGGRERARPRAGPPRRPLSSRAGRRVRPEGSRGGFLQAILTPTLYIWRITSGIYTAWRRETSACDPKDMLRPDLEGSCMGAAAGAVQTFDAILANPAAGAVPILTPSCVFNSRFSIQRVKGGGGMNSAPTPRRTRPTSPRGSAKRFSATAAWVASK